MTGRDLISAFLAEGPWAVVGASADRGKFGNKVLRSYQGAHMGPLYPVNPRADEVEGLAAYPDLASTPEPARGVSIITPPDVTESVVDDAIAAGAEFVWMQPGAESDAAIEAARAAGLGVIAHGPCVLVELGFSG